MQHQIKIFTKLRKWKFCCHPTPTQSAVSTQTPLLSARRFFNVAQQCYFEMKTNTEPYFSILSSIVLCSSHILHTSSNIPHHFSSTPQPTTFKPRPSTLHSSTINPIHILNFSSLVSQPSPFTPYPSPTIQYLLPDTSKYCSYISIFCQLDHLLGKSLAKISRNFNGIFAKLKNNFRFREILKMLFRSHPRCRQ